jgi:hypothetical protein
MRQAREIIRLKSSSVATHEIARRLGLAHSTVRETLKRSETADLAWPLPEDMNDEAVYANRRSKRGHRRIAEPDWASVHRELKRKHVTLLILWDEYIAANPGGYGSRSPSGLLAKSSLTAAIAGLATVLVMAAFLVRESGDFDITSLP